jgi:hypothetical protein
MESQLEHIKAHLSIALAWELLGLRGKPAKECRSPFREDSRPSFSIYRQGRWERWFDHGEGIGGDVIDLWAKAKTLPGPEAISDLLGVIPALRLDSSHFGYSPRVKTAEMPLSALKSVQSAIRWPPDLRLPLEEECRALGALRGLEPAAFDLAARLGTLKVAIVYRQLSWIITDLHGRCAEARRFDGHPFLIAGKEIKSFTLPGSRKDWPLGLKTCNPDFDALGKIVLVEGMPDYFAGLALAIGTPINLRPLAMLGAGVRLSPEVGELLRGRHVLVIPHNDLAGEASLEHRLKDLRALGVAKLSVQKLPFECDDLNDFLRLNPLEPRALLQGFENGYSQARRTQTAAAADHRRSHD